MFGLLRDCFLFFLVIVCLLLFGLLGVTIGVAICCVTYKTSSFLVSNENFFLGMFHVNLVSRDSYLVLDLQKTTFWWSLEKKKEVIFLLKV